MVATFSDGRTLLRGPQPRRVGLPLLAPAPTSGLGSFGVCCWIFVVVDEVLGWRAVRLARAALGARPSPLLTAQTTNNTPTD